jgi:hypothetical protein
MTAADQIRRAAARLRELAEGARAGDWFTEPSDLTPDATLVLAKWQHGQRRVATCSGSLPEGNAANAAYIAALGPDVGLALADLLDLQADMGDAAENDPTTCHSFCTPALAVARKILGES